LKGGLHLRTKIKSNGGLHIVTEGVSFKKQKSLYGAYYWFNESNGKTHMKLLTTNIAELT